MSWTDTIKNTGKKFGDGVSNLTKKTREMQEASRKRQLENLEHQAKKSALQKQVAKNKAAAAKSKKSAQKDLPNLFGNEGGPKFKF